MLYLASDKGWTISNQPATIVSVCGKLDPAPAE